MTATTDSEQCGVKIVCKTRHFFTISMASLLFINLQWKNSKHASNTSNLDKKNCPV